MQAQDIMGFNVVVPIQVVRPMHSVFANTYRDLLARRSPHMKTSCAQAGRGPSAIVESQVTSRGYFRCRNDFNARIPSVAQSASFRGSSNSRRILKPITSAPKRILISRIPTAKFLGGDATGPLLGSSGSLQEKLQCGHAFGMSRISSGETVSRDLHL